MIQIIETPEEQMVVDLYNKLGGASKMLTTLANIYAKAAIQPDGRTNRMFIEIAETLNEVGKVIALDETTSETIEDIARRLTEQGYRRGAPSPHAESVDRVICAGSTCSECGHVGLDYVPFYKSNSYRSFMACPKCDYVAEI